ncbi:putative P450 monooxygenase [Exophiala xenobiotica]|uniref:P450 monooxygenase n=1 Tax=Lithohypha guttulata TaxID=1690604 RepID=A0ABR0JX40_9EURO|nr:putative P450 monooxygenase [Lithohypha guttulata]KAK5329119.1 putative P450 monooxygenase [Exophiala xenobiotica]
MASIILLTIAISIIYLLTNHVRGLRQNVLAAKKSGIHYIVVPVFFMERWWLVGHRLLFPLLKKLPPSWTRWVDFTLPEFTYDYSHEVFKRVRHDTFLTVSPGGICMYTCEPAAIAQITTRRNDFPKPTHIYTSVDIYGKNVVSTERDIWRKHRKATSPPFTEKNNHLVWNESIRQAQAMLTSWVGDDGKGNRTVDRLMDDTMRLSLNVISAAGFGRKMDWPTPETESREDESGYVDPSKIKNEDRDIDPGHKMSYTYAIHCLLDNILLQFLMPRWLLSRLPGVTPKKANEAYHEWGNYMRELVMNKKADLEAGKAPNDTNDILTLLVKQQLVNTDAKAKGQLTESEILGNMFVLILAGHETAANSIHFSAVYLALFPDSQRRLQKDLDQIFAGKPPSEWDYDRDLPQLFGGMAGAVLAEELRLVPPVTGIPKSTMEGVGPQKLAVEDKECLVPANTYISLCTGAAHRHPGYWPTSKPRLAGGHTAHPVANIDNDLEEFRPERWLISDTADGTTVTADGLPVETLAKEDGLGVNESSDTSDRLFKPIKGAYLPFSDGYRACLGRRFAQVEVLAVLAVLFQNYSVELAVDKYATDAELEKMNDDEKAEIWHKAAEDVRELLLNGLGVIITLQIRKGTVPFRFVPKGQEKFPDNVDEIWKRNHSDQISETGVPGWRSWAGTPKKRGGSGVSDQGI